MMWLIMMTTFMMLIRDEAVEKSKSKNNSPAPPGRIPNPKNKEYFPERGSEDRSKKRSRIPGHDPQAVLKEVHAIVHLISKNHVCYRHPQRHPGAEGNRLILTLRCAGTSSSCVDETCKVPGFQVDLDVRASSLEAMLSANGMCTEVHLVREEPCGNIFVKFRAQVLRYTW